jgi:hypothetical protein
MLECYYDLIRQGSAFVRPSGKRITLSRHIGSEGTACFLDEEGIELSVPEATQKLVGPVFEFISGGKATE